MKSQAEVPAAKQECAHYGSAFSFLVAGLGIGAAVSMLMAPKSGVETRKWIATRCLDKIDSANEKVRQARVQFHELVDQGQEKVSEAVKAGREAFIKETQEANVKPS